MSYGILQFVFYQRMHSLLITLLVVVSDMPVHTELPCVWQHRFSNGGITQVAIGGITQVAIGGITQVRFIPKCGQCYNFLPSVL